MLLWIVPGEVVGELRAPSGSPYVGLHQGGRGRPPRPVRIRRRGGMGRPVPRQIVPGR
jgi:hypothetical protein